VLVWALSGPVFQFSETWQLIINTGTTIVTFLMVFLIQNTQNRDGAAIQTKLDELIRTSEAEDEFMGIEKLTDKELEQILQDFEVEGHATSLGRKSEIIDKKATQVRARQRREQGKTKQQTAPTKRTAKVKARA